MVQARGGGNGHGGGKTPPYEPPLHPGPAGAGGGLGMERPRERRGGSGRRTKVSVWASCSGVGDCCSCKMAVSMV